MRAFVEDHDDVVVERLLHRHGLLRPEENFGTVHRRLEPHALLAQLSQLSQAPYLKSARVREEGTVPVHEAVQPAMRLDRLQARPQHEMKGVSEDDIGSGLA